MNGGYQAEVSSANEVFIDYKYGQKALTKDECFAAIRYVEKVLAMKALQAQLDQRKTDLAKFKAFA